MDDPLLALLPKARRRWARTDPVLARIAREYPPPGRTVARAPPFEALVTSVLHQQVSLAAGRSITERLRVAQGGGAITPDGILRLTEEDLRTAGLSRPKVRYVRDLASHAAGGALDFQRLATAPDADVVEALTAVKGIGVWTAKMFLLFHLDRPDVLPHEDLGVQLAVVRAYGVPREAAAAKIRALGPAWSPYASVAALTLWAWRREGDVVPPSAAAGRAPPPPGSTPRQGRRGRGSPGKASGPRR